MNKEFYKLNAESVWYIDDVSHRLKSMAGSKLFKRLKVFYTSDDQAYLFYQEYTKVNPMKLKYESWEKIGK